MRTRGALLWVSLIAAVIVAGVPGMVVEVAAATPISSCMGITDSGSYELVQNIQSWGGDCLMVQADFVTIDLKGYGIFGNGGSGTAVLGWGRGLVVRGGTIYNFFTAVRGGEGLVVEQMRIVSNSVGVDGTMLGSAIVKDSVFNDNRQWGVAVNSGTVSNSVFNRNETGVSAGSFYWFGAGVTAIVNNGFTQNNYAIQSQGTGASIRNNTIDGGNVGLSVACPSHIVGNTVVRAGMPLMVQNNNVWDCAFEHNSIRQF